MVWQRSFLLIAVATTGCTGLVVDLAARSLGTDSSVYASDDDPALVREAIPFGLKTIESLLASSPDNPKLLLAAASGFAQYAYAFVQRDAEQIEPTDPAQARRLLARCRRMYARARRYALAGLEARHTGFQAALAQNRQAAASELTADDVPLAYWTAVAWAAEIAISKDNLALVAELGMVEALMDRALELDESFDAGAIHEFYVAYDGGRSEALGGSIARARKHFERALELSGGKKISPFVTWAGLVSVGTQDRREFDAYLDRALTFNPDEAPQFRLANLIAQEQARRLKARAGDLFLEE